MAEVYVPRLKQHYVDTVRPQLMEKFSYSNALQVPKFDKVVLNMGVGEAVGDGKIINTAAEELAKIAGQKPVITRARKSIATYKIRENMPIGVKVTLNDQVIHENVEMKAPTPSCLTGKEAPKGPLMFQGDHGPVAYRNIKITPK